MVMPYIDNQPLLVANAPETREYRMNFWDADDANGGDEGDGVEESPMRVKKDEAVRRLRAAGFNQEAKQLDTWRDVNGNNWGWDGWVRKALPHIVATIWQ
jgi:hypothetical protein